MDGAALFSAGRGGAKKKICRAGRGGAKKCVNRLIQNSIYEIFIGSFVMHTKFAKGIMISLKSRKIFVRYYC